MMAKATTKPTTTTTTTTTTGRTTRSSGKKTNAQTVSSSSSLPVEETTDESILLPTTTTTTANNTSTTSLMDTFAGVGDNHDPNPDLTNHNLTQQPHPHYTELINEKDIDTLESIVQSNPVLLKIREYGPTAKREDVFPTSRYVRTRVLYVQ
jgi:hypothetical protein